MNLSAFTPYVGSIIRHALVTGGILETSKAEDVSGQLAGALVALVGAIWAQYNAHKSKASAPDSKGP